MRLGKLRYDSKFMAVKFFHKTKGWSINWMCKQLEISRAAYYKWLHREIPKQELENTRLAELIKEYDERFTSVIAHQAMIAGGMKKSQRQDKAVVDKIAACIILEGYMDSIKNF